ncbi:MAG: hypothetical protein ACRDWH_08045 [Acidimicrobiia bacterium]
MALSKTSLPQPPSSWSSSVNAAGAAIAAAIDDALGMPGAVTVLPFTPDRLRDLIRLRPLRSHPIAVGLVV